MASQRFVFISSTHAPSSANATPEFEGRGGEELGVELSNTLYKVFNNKHSVDLKGLCISAREHCWVLYVDVLVSLNRQKFSHFNYTTVSARTGLLNLCIALKVRSVSDCFFFLSAAPAV